LTGKEHSMSIPSSPPVPDRPPGSRHGVTVAMIALLVALGLTSSQLSASAATETKQPTHDAATRTTELKFGVRFSPFRVVDVPPKATHPGDFQPGDYTVFSDVLTDRTGRHVGTEAGSGLIT